MRLPWQRRPRAREMRPRATSVYKTHRTRTTASTTLVSCVVLVAAAAQVGSAQAYSAFPGQRTHSPCTTDADCIYDGCGDSPHFQSPAGCYSTPIIYYSPISYRACGQSSRVGDGLDQYRSCDPPAAPGWGNCNECPERPCPPGTYSRNGRGGGAGDGATTCFPCINGSISTEKATSCTCMSGYTFLDNELACRPCPDPQKNTCFSVSPRTCGPCAFFTDLQGVLRLTGKCAGKCDDKTASNELDLRGMGIKKFMPGIFHNLTEVKTLLLGENPLDNVPGEIVSSLIALETVILNEVDLSKVNLTMAGLKRFELVEIPYVACGECKFYRNISGAIQKTKKCNSTCESIYFSFYDGLPMTMESGLFANLGVKTLYLGGQTETIQANIFGDNPSLEHFAFGGYMMSASLKYLKHDLFDGFPKLQSVYFSFGYSSEPEDERSRLAGSMKCFPVLLNESGLSILHPHIPTCPKNCTSGTYYVPNATDTLGGHGHEWTHGQFGHGSCEICPPNTYMPGVGARSCLPCPGGSVSEAGSQSCVARTPGTLCQKRPSMCQKRPSRKPELSSSYSWYAVSKET